MIIRYLALILIAFGGGVTVGTATAAFISILQIVPRLIQITNTRDRINLYQSTIIISFILAILVYFGNFSLYLPKIINIPIGFIIGIFVGLLSSALAEVLNVIPILSKKLKVKDSLKYIVWALTGGKVAGALVYWLLLD
ncbi:MAG: stage V sporulation protein AB [Tissierellia bacterium]|nr:stage V sporulation protein AB [Tissierellia bacterium]